MNTFVIGDIHGGKKALEQVLEKANVSKTDTLIFLGDYVDGWSESPQTIDFLINLQKSNNCIYLRGNHDELLLQWLQYQHDNKLWLSHGGASSVKAYQNISVATKQKHIEFLLSLKNYYIDKQNRLFVHAGFTNLKGINAEHYQRLLFWDRSLWELALCVNPNLPKNSPYYPNRLKLYKEVFIGHTPVTQINETVPVNKANIWNIDTGAAFKGPLSILDIETKEYWQSDPVYTLYPNEKGRNDK